MKTLIERALEEYEKLHKVSADRVREVEIKFPDAITKEGERINLNELLNRIKGLPIFVQGGEAIMLLYHKDGRFFLRVYTGPAVITKPVNRDSPVYIIEGDQMITKEV